MWGHPALPHPRGDGETQESTSRSTVSSQATAEGLGSRPGPSASQLRDRVGWFSPAPRVIVFYRDKIHTT